MDFVLEPSHWFVIGFVLIAFEIILPSFAALWFGLSAIIVGIIVWLIPSLGTPTQFIIWAVLSILCTFLWFKFIKPLSIDKTQAGLSREATIGQVGMVIQVNLAHDHIRVRFPIPVLGSDEWNCRSLHPLQVGDRVSVVDILGNDLMVQPYSTIIKSE